MKNINKELKNILNNAGFRCVIINVDRLLNLMDAFQCTIESEMVKRSFYDEIVTRYDLHWDFQPLIKLPDIKSIILLASPLPKVCVKFRMDGEIFSTIIPSTYLHDTDDVCRSIVSRYLGRYDYRIHDAILPEKLLAVKSGLAEYGKNNIAYVDGFGSYFRLKTFFTDMPSSVDVWRKSRMMVCCESCSICRNICPTGAIPIDRFLIHGERCLTFFNEGSEDFPGWIDPSWHHCLFGCVWCQDVCPVNQKFNDWIVDGESFSEEETRMILDGKGKNELPDGMHEKLKKMYLIEYYNLLRRNLSLLMLKLNIKA